MKGIILAGGTGSRLWPITLQVSKQMLPIYSKPMVYYPLSVLMLAGIRDILLISTPKDLPLYRNLLGSGDWFGCRMQYIEQSEPKGLADAFILGETFIDGEDVALILGDNIFYGSTFTAILRSARADHSGATVFGYQVKDPQRYGVAEVDMNGRVRSLEEKPETPKSSIAVTGLYLYDGDVSEKAQSLKPSRRNEIEITDLNRLYLKEDRLTLTMLPRGMAWLDTGTPQSLLHASNYIEAIETRQGLLVACLEEIAYRQGYIDKTLLINRANSLEPSDYANYLLRLLEEKS